MKLDMKSNRNREDQTVQECFIRLQKDSGGILSVMSPVMIFGLSLLLASYSRQRRQDHHFVTDELFHDVLPDFGLTIVAKRCLPGQWKFCIVIFKTGNFYILQKSQMQW